MAGAGRAASVLALLLVSALLGVLGERPIPDLGAHPGTSDGCWREAGPPGRGVPAADGWPSSTERRSQGRPGAAEPRPPPRDQRERAGPGSLPVGALYTAAVVAFVLYKCLQGPDEAATLQEEKNKKKSLQSEQQLVQLTQQLAQTEQHLNNLMTQLDPLFERVTTLVGAQRALLNTKLKTIHQLLQDCKPGPGVEFPEPAGAMGAEAWP
ncbi:coiled-coil domain-containing protein 107 isoform X3 [Psammomys obesus]|uniref:coiled-coil domain-containing protein 107 isoform X3 n=1 Tax=Psammomys obesus TaxID=48139 RepID=UPI002452BEC0|nr:coiled-coil domain-containing protein 107 isoform X3 [Psammomys obesus]